EQFATNEEKVVLVPQHKIEEFKNSHPDWHDLSPHEIGCKFKVDYVVVLEISQLSLYEKGRTMYRGQAQISLTLVDVSHPDEPACSPFSYQYPSEAKGGGMDIDSTMPPSRFRADFLDMMAKRLVRYFAAHSSRDLYDVD